MKSHIELTFIETDLKCPEAPQLIRIDLIDEVRQLTPEQKHVHRDAGALVFLTHLKGDAEYVIEKYGSIRNQLAIKRDKGNEGR